MENWKKVKGYESYEVSDRHRVRTERGIILTIWVDKAGRHYVAMKKDGDKRRRYIAELVEEAFAPEQEAEQAQKAAVQIEADIVTPKRKPAKTAKKRQ